MSPLKQWNNSSMTENGDYNFIEFTLQILFITQIPD